MPEHAYLKTKREAARYLGISPGSLERLMRSDVAYIRVGNLIRFRPEDLAEFIERQRVQRSGDARKEQHSSPAEGDTATQLVAAEAIST